jgi:hypothetical protein
LAHAQTTAVVKDKITNEPIPYVNIWIEGINSGATANKTGEFTLFAGQDKTLVFSAIGYETLKILVKDMQQTVLLAPAAIQLQEVVVNNTMQNTLEFNINKFKKADILSRYGCSSIPWMVARYYPYKEVYEATPYLKSFEFYTTCTLKNAVFNVRLYLPDENGQPGEYFYDENILCTVKKGKTITKLDISKLNIRLPKEGFFVAVEWLLIPENFDENMAAADIYQPAFGTIATIESVISCTYVFGQWKPFKQTNISPAIALTLSN